MQSRMRSPSSLAGNRIVTCGGFAGNSIGGRFSSIIRPRPLNMPNAKIPHVTGPSSR